MKKFSATLFQLFLLAAISHGQVPIKQMTWQNQFTIELVLSNDSNYILDVKELYHSTYDENGKEDGFAYYPVRLGADFIEQLKSRNLDTGTDSLQSTGNKKAETLFNALHLSLGGGWSHFLNCLLYSLETNQLDLTSPLMKRPKTNWKPKPMTKPYKRTKKWEYYIPVNQGLALKEYAAKKREKNLSGLEGIPKEFIDLFLKKTNKSYQKLIESNNIKEKAKIDMVKLLLGANYLGDAQISYIKNMVLKAASQYTANMLPSVIIFDNLNAAVAMTLNEEGYRTEKIIYYDDKHLSLDERNERTARIENIITNINAISKQIFENKLKSYYKQNTKKNGN